MTPSCRVELRARRGFTMVELLVAIVVSVIIVLILAEVNLGALKSSTTNNNSFIALSSANASLDLLANDLQSMAPNPQPSPVGAGSYEFLQARPDPNTSNLNNTTPALLMLNTASAQDSISYSSDLGIQPRAVCYQLAFQDPINPSNTNPKATVYGLYRTVKSSATTFASFLGQSDLYAGTGRWQTLSASLPATSSFIVGNVVDFQLVFYACRISSGQLLSVPVAVYSTALAGSGATAGVLHLTSAGYTISSASANLDPSYLNHGPIVYVDVTVVALENNGAVQLASGAISLATAKSRYGHSLTRRIALQEPF